MAEKLKLRWWMESCDLPESNESGAQIRSLTSAPALTTDVYCEQPYCSADGNRLAMYRSFDTNPAVPGQLLVYDIKAYRVAVLQKEVFSIANAAWSGVLLVTVGIATDKRLIRVDLNTLECENLFAWGDIPGGGLLTVSADSRYGLSTSWMGEQSFGVFRVDLTNGQYEMIYDGPYICNPHLQFRLYNASRILVLENRGCLFDAAGAQIRPLDERGATLFTLAADGSDRQDFPIGLPDTTAATGHTCWVGDTDHVLGTLHTPYDDGLKRGTVVELAHAWPQARVIFETAHCWNHISASRCGRYFVADCYDLPGVPILIGSIRTGKTQILCESKTSGGGGQYSHAHPYITSDNRYVVFNSDRTGLAQVHIASIPSGLLENLDTA